jgi:HPt (histidine-containing phosphotransfer) domain-containing protein
VELGEVLKKERWVTIKSMFLGSETPVERVVEVFIQGADRNLDRIRRGREADRRDWCVDASHSLKSSSANLGLERLSVVSAHLESNARTMTLGELDQVILILSAELGDARGALLAHLEENP